MGKEVAPVSFSRADRMRYRCKVRRCLDALGLMLDASGFDSRHPMTGFEIELVLVEADREPAMRNSKVLASLADPSFQTEFGQYNLELNARPRLIADAGLADYAQDLTERLRRAEEAAAKVDATVVMIGILPTLTPVHTIPENFSSEPRYQLINEEILAARGEQISVDIRGVERLRLTTDSIGPQAASTSVQCHLQVSPETFADYWNASQAIAGVQLAVGANSPYLYGRQLWHETRIALFEQATDTRTVELKAQGVRPRAWFGERWISSIFDLFEENVHYFPPLLPICQDEDPMEVLRAGGVPSLAELRLHNGTIYRWNRPVYDIMAGRPHLRVENRVLPSGPTLVDLLANAAFYFGLTRALAEEERPVWNRLTFSAAEANLHLGARHGIAADLYWPGLGEVPATHLVLEYLLPKAYDGLDRFGVDRRLRDELLEVITQRCLAGRNGAVWQIQAVAEEERRGRSRPEALRAMLARYLAYQHTNEPVHTWPIG